MKQSYLLQKLLLLVVLLAGSAGLNAQKTSYALVKGATSFFKFDADQGLAQTETVSLGDYTAESGVLVGDKYYMEVSTDDEETYHWGYYDLTTGTTNFVETSASSALSDVTYDETTSTFYAVNSGNLYSIDAETGKRTVAATISLPRQTNYYSIGADGKGGFYVIAGKATTQEAFLWTVPATLDSYTQVGKITLPEGYTGFGGHVSLFTGADNVLYVAYQAKNAESAQESFIATVDVATAALTKVGEGVIAGGKVRGLSVIAPKAETPEEPEQPEAKEWVVDAPWTGTTQSSYDDNGKEKWVFTGKWAATDGTEFDVALKQNTSSTSDPSPVFNTDHVRFYAGTELTITAPESVGTIKKVVIDATTTNYANVGLTVSSGTVTINGTQIVWQDPEGTATFTAVAPKQIRFNKVTISNSVGEEVEPVITEVKDIAAFLADKGANATYEFTNPVSVAYQYGKNTYVQDESAWMVIYGDVEKTYTTGMSIPAGFQGSYGEYNGAAQLVPNASTFAEGVTGEITAAEVEIAAITTDMLNRYVVVKGVNIVGGNAVKGETTLTLYNNFKIDGITADAENVDIYGIVGAYNGNVQVYPIEVKQNTIVPEEPEVPATGYGYGVIYQGSMFKFDLAKGLEATETIDIVGEDGTAFKTVNGVLAGDKYYMQVVGSSYRWGYYDLTEAKFVDLGATSSVRDITYDESTETFYGAQSATIYTIDATGARSSWYAGKAAQIAICGVAADGKGGIYAVVNNYATSSVELWHFAADKTIDSTVTIAWPEGYGTIDNYSSLTVANNGDLYYALRAKPAGGSSKVSVLTKINATTGAVTFVGESTQITETVSGLSVVADNAGTPDTPDQPAATEWIIEKPWEGLTLTDGDKYSFDGEWTATDGTKFTVNISQANSTTGASNVMQADHVRFYVGAELTITAPESVGTFKQVTFECKADKIGEITVTSGTVTTVGNQIIWQNTEGVTSLTVTDKSQSRITKVTVSKEVSEIEEPKAIEVENIAAFLKAPETGKSYEFKNAVSVAYQNGSNLYVQDASGWMFIYGNVGKTYTNGMTIPAGFQGSYELYKGTIEFIPVADTFQDGVEGEALAPAAVLISDINNEMVNRYIVLNGVEIADGNIVKEGASVVLYNKFKLADDVIANAKNVNITGIVGQYNGTLQIFPIEVVAGSTDTPEEFDPFEVVTKVQTVYTLGNAMDGVGTSKKEVTFYGSKNQIVRSVRYTDDEAYGYGRYLYSTDAEGNSVVEVAWRTKKAGAGSVDEFDRYWQAYTTTEYQKWTYSPAGLLLKHSTVNGDEEYTYEGNNLVTKLTLYASDTNKAGQAKEKVVYSDFLEGFENLPQTAITSTAFKATIAEIEYDANGNMVKRTTTKSVTGDKGDDGLYMYVDKGTPETLETWTYDENGKVTLYLNQKWSTANSVYEDKKKTVYENTENTVTETSYDYDKYTGWTSNGTSKMTETAEFYGASAVTNFTVTQDATVKSSYLLTADMPMVATDMTKTIAFNVYRNGDIVGQMTLNEDATGLEFVDTNVFNGTHDWFVQTVLVDMEGNVQGLNSSDAVEFVAALELNPVTVANATSAYDAEARRIVANFTWEAPVADGAVILGYNVYVDPTYINYANPNNTELITESLSYEFEWNPSVIKTEADKVKSYYIETVYDFGKVMSQEFKVTLDTSAVPELLPVTATSTEIVYNEGAGNFAVTINWEAPETVGASIMGYNIYLDGATYEANEDNAITGTSYSVTWERGEHSYMIETIYDLGKAMSEVFVVNVSEVVGIGSVELGDMTLTVENDIVTVNGACDAIEVYSVSGMLVARSESNSVELAADGAFVVIVKAGENSKVVKIVK